MTHRLFAFVLLFATVASAQSAKPAWPTPWLGVHMLVGGEAQINDLVDQAPKLAAMGVNALIVEVNYSFDFRSHPELGSRTAVTKAGAARLAETCRKNKIRLIPQLNCLGHQSWAANTLPLLTKHPEFDETPGQYPGNKGIYCRSWCPLNPDVNPMVFDLMDELIDAFSADAFHVGMDEVFLIGSDFCPRCKGKDKGELFAKAVNDYHAHLVGQRKVEMFMWPDRLL
ncbi:MAG: family 20 glycosylhydrolase, partial [Tepidisphaeraceae bacterium]